MLVTLAYGDVTAQVDVPDSHPSRTLHLPQVRSLESPAEAILDALDHPIGSKRMDEIFRRGERTTVVVPDGTRQARTATYMPILLDRLNRLGIADHDILVVIATGSHRLPDPTDLHSLVGKPAAARVAVVAHNSRDDSQLVYLGDTVRGTPVWLNRRVVQGERIVVTGTVVHHYFAGYGGGAKMIMPGCAGYETIRRNHSHTVSSENGGLHPGCDLGVIDGNPVQEDIRDAIKFVSVDWLLHTIVNAGGELVGVVSGEMFAAHAVACRRVDDLYCVPLGERGDIVVASCGGYPKDVTFIQAHKALHNAYRAVKPGGSVILFAECREGIGSSTFLEWFRFLTAAAMTRALCEDYKLNGHTALATLQKASSARIVLVSDLEADVVRRMGMQPAADAVDAWRLASHGAPSDASVVVIPCASLLVPQVERSS